ncbi:MAG: c-type cytochrome [Mariprofundaceae bacterium]
MMKWPAIGIAAALLAPCIWTIPVQADEQRPETNSVPHEKGREIFNFRCYFCHGYSGNAKTLAASYLDPRPLDFTALSVSALSRKRMVESVTHGRPKTAMQGFANILTNEEIALVVDFIRLEFMTEKAENTRYHTIENGWENHERYKAAYPFALGDIPIDQPWEELTDQQQAGKRLFMSSCITCHDRAKALNTELMWQTRAISTPRNIFAEQADVDATSGASIMAMHDVPPDIAGLSDREKQGERLYQQNCAFCHAADGTGRNWIGSFLEPHPRNFTSAEEMAGISWEHMEIVIRKGLPDTTMSAWESALSTEEISAIIAYISRAFHPVVKSGKKPATPLRQAPKPQWQATEIPLAAP